MFDLISGIYPPKAQWTVDQIPDQTGRIAIVTGGNSGIGYETVLNLLRKNAKVYLVARSEERAKEAIDKLKAEKLPGEVVFMKMDQASLKDIKRFAEEYMKKESRIDMLFNSAGVMAPKVGEKTADGYELHVGTNSLGSHYLTTLLLPALRATKEQTGHPARVCFTSSIAHRFTSSKGFDPEDYTGLHSPPRFIPGENRAYGTSKFCNILSAKWFNRHYGKDGIVFTSCHPGNLRTGLTRDWNKGLHAVLVPIVKSVVLYPQEMGCISQLYLNTAPEAESKGGAYYVPWAREAEPMPQASDEKIQESFATWVDEQVAKHIPA